MPMPKNILAVRNDRFGEFLLNIPALRALKETFGGSRIIAVVSPYVRELAACVPFIDEIIPWGQEKHSFYQKIKLIRLLKQKKIDLAVMLNPSRDFHLFTWLAGIPRRAGYDRKWGFLLTHKLKDEKYRGLKHEVNYNLELAGLVGAATEDKTLSLNISEIAPSGCIVLHPWTSDAVKQWPVENFRELAQRLIKERGLPVAVIGGRQEQEKAQAEFCAIPGLINLAGKTSLVELAAFLKQCRLLISGDSGPMHLAAAVGTPVVAIFRNDLPEKSCRRWGPWGAGHSVIEKNNLKDISVEEVLQKIKEKLDR